METAIALIVKIQVFSLISSASFNHNLDNFQVAAGRFRRANRQKPTCLQPPITPDKSYTVRSPPKHETSDAEPGKIVQEYTIIIARCNEGHAVDYKTNISSEFPSFCGINSWQPAILKCKKTCKTISHLSNFNMTCYEYFGGPKIPCNDRLLEHAIVFPKCQNNFHPDKKVNHDYATCREDGTWDKPFFKCIPDCGVASNAIELIAGGFPEKRGGAPWNVAIYSTQLNSKMPELICGGTLINAEFVISAAHCFYDDDFRQKLDITLFRAIVGKITRDYNKQDYNTTKTYTLKNIYLPETYRGSLTNFGSDIAVLQLPEKVFISRDVRPACLSWDDRTRFNPDKNVIGKLSGFGVTENGSLADALYTTQLPFISNDECLNKVREDFLSSVSVDKFCIGSDNGPGARPGDSGGGVIFMDHATGLYHLRGVISTKDLDVNCGNLDDIDNGTVNITSNRTTFGAEAVYKCNTNYTLLGKNIRTCGKDGVWTGQQPECLHNHTNPNQAPPCDPAVCVLPECFCSDNGTVIPNNLSSKDVPQMITITFDNNINNRNIKLYRDIFNGKRKNPNGCDIKATFFLTHKWTNYSAIQEIHRKGHEIAVHSITHKDDNQFWSKATVDDWAKEMAGMRIIIEKYANLTDKSVVGVRAPFLWVGGNNQFTMMKKQSFLYDSTITAPLSNPPLWPYTMHFRMPHRCHGNLQHCPTQSHPVWEMVLNEMDQRTDPNSDKNLPGCNMTDYCNNILTGDQFYNFLNHNFDRHYNQNRAPLGLHFHSDSLLNNNPKFLDSFLFWVDEILRKHNDVYFVTMTQVIQWIQNPRTVTETKNFDIWKEKCAVKGDLPCKASLTCRLASKELPGEIISLPTCVRCPNKYPWIEDPTGDGFI